MMEKDVVTVAYFGRERERTLVFSEGNIFLYRGKSERFRKPGDTIAVPRTELERTNFDEMDYLSRKNAFLGYVD